MHLEAWQIATAIAATFLIGFSKTGVPGSGILVVPMMASVFGGHLSIGATLPLLIAADCFAVAFYRSHADWSVIRRLAPYVVVGILGGVAFLHLLPPGAGSDRLLKQIIGGIVLAMVALHLLRGKLGDRLVPHSPVGTVFTGMMAGFTTMASNAAGPVMAIYMASTGLPKQKLMGTSAWYFFLLNVFKLPFVFALTSINAKEPLITLDSLKINAMLIPVIVLGAFLGRKLLPYIPEKLFTALIILLAALAAFKLLIFP